MTDCATCGGLGIVRTDKGSRPCDCQISEEKAVRLKRAQIPPAFAAATLEGFRPSQHTQRGLEAASAFVREFLPGVRNQNVKGLLFTGTVGTGKTHLACAIARELIEQKGIEARFVDIRELLDRLRASYDDDARETQAQIMRSILRADLAVIDELGATKPSDWVFETIELLIGTLYNRMVPVIVTTNLPNLPVGGVAGEGGYSRAARMETLGDRLGMRIFSRLQQMCRPVEMSGPDYRVKR